MLYHFLKLGKWESLGFPVVFCAAGGLGWVTDGGHLLRCFPPDGNAVEFGDCLNSSTPFPSEEMQAAGFISKGWYLDPTRTSSQASVRKGIFAFPFLRSVSSSWADRPPRQASSVLWWGLFSSSFSGRWKWAQQSMLWIHIYLTVENKDLFLFPIRPPVFS